MSAANPTRHAAWPRRFALTDAGRSMLLIKSLDPGAVLTFSEYTNGWYVQARIDIGDGVMLGGVIEHRPTPDAAVDAFIVRITAVEAPEYVAVRANYDDRRNVRWNGAAFVDVELPRFDA